MFHAIPTYLYNLITKHKDEFIMEFNWIAQLDHMIHMLIIFNILKARQTLKIDVTSLIC